MRLRGVLEAADWGLLFGVVVLVLAKIGILMLIDCSRRLNLAVPGRDFLATSDEIMLIINFEF